MNAITPTITDEAARDSLRLDRVRALLERLEISQRSAEYNAVQGLSKVLGAYHEGEARAFRIVIEQLSAAIS